MRTFSFPQFFVMLFVLGLSWVSVLNAQIADKPTEISPLLVGEKIPSSVLATLEGKEMSTGSIFTVPTVLVFYRGGWCPYCNKQLAALGIMESEIKAMGYQVVAISPDAPEALSATMSKAKLSYKLYSDAGGSFIQAMGLAFKAPSNYNDLLKKSSGGMNNGMLPVPAVYVVNANAEVEFMYVNPDYKRRLSESILRAVLVEYAPKK